MTAPNRVEFTVDLLGSQGLAQVPARCWRTGRGRFM